MPQRDQFPSRSAGASPREWFSITPDDDNDLAQVPQAIWVGVGGDLVLQGRDGHVEPFKNVPNGFLFIGSPVRVMQATTATFLKGMV